MTSQKFYVVYTELFLLIIKLWLQKRKWCNIAYLLYFLPSWFRMARALCVKWLQSDETAVDI